MINSYKRFWTKGFDFKGRSTRNEYWLGAVLANFIVSILLFIIVVIYLASYVGYLSSDEIIIFL